MRQKESITLTLYNTILIGTVHNLGGQVQFSSFARDNLIVFRTLEVRKSLARKLMAEVVHQEED